MTDYPETTLVGLAHGGNLEAFGILVQRHEASLMGYVSTKVHCWADAQDIVQDTFLDALRGLYRFDTGRPFRPWLRAICRNRLRRHYRTWARKQGRCVSLSDEDVARKVEAERSTEADAGNAEELFGIVHRCVSGLNIRHAELLALLYGEDLSVDEVARRTGRSPHNVAQTVYRARQRLKRSITLRLRQPNRHSFLPPGTNRGL